MNRNRSRNDKDNGSSKMRIYKADRIILKYLKETMNLVREMEHIIIKTRWNFST